MNPIDTVVLLPLVAGACLFLVSSAAGGEAPPLRETAKEKGLWVGPALSAGMLDKDDMYWEVAAREFNFVTAENAFKWKPLSRERGIYDFTATDRLVDFAEANGMDFHGHVFLWHQANPEWLVEGDFSREEMLAIMKAHIGTVGGRYRGRIAVWDVVNEAFSDNGEPPADDGKGFRNTFWLKRIGPDYMDHAFRMAREVLPKTQLLYNDYGFENGNAKADAIYEHLKEMLAKGVPVDGLGFQVHVQPGEVNIPAFRKNLRRFADLGLDLYITEMDVRIPDDAGDEALAAQAEAYAEIVGAFLDEPKARGVQMWGFTDKRSWVPAFFKGHGRALLFDKEYRPKASYSAVSRALEQTASRATEKEGK